MLQISFNPLDRGNLNQMHNPETYNYESDYQCFNPLDRGNLNQIPVQLGFTKQEVIVSIP